MHIRPQQSVPRKSNSTPPVARILPATQLARKPAHVLNVLSKNSNGAGARKRIDCCRANRSRAFPLFPAGRRRRRQWCTTSAESRPPFPERTPRRPGETNGKQRPAIIDVLARNRPFPAKNKSAGFSERSRLRDGGCKYVGRTRNKEGGGGGDSSWGTETKHSEPHLRFFSPLGVLQLL